MPIAAWTFRLQQQAGTFDVKFNVANESYSEVRLHRIKVLYEADGVTVRTTETTRIAVVELPTSGPGSITVDAADAAQPDVFYIAHCRAFQGVQPQPGWKWVLGVHQSGPCGL